MANPINTVFYCILYFLIYLYFYIFFNKLMSK
nr:MAG TPA: hypothetical protein [Caudoviricetes sp.]DAN89670.1 MAG TPA: hypothetical protein [Caudoviricetes sp.]DAR01435.1 MAG TPA: hypothetical protein [Caudoviricetes sp.]